jgi:sec1 family domain-containing protein 1
MLNVSLLSNRQLHSTRPPLPDVPAIYFVSPTLQNVKRIGEDLNAGLYESYHLSFIEPLPRALLEELASQVARDGTSESVEQVRLLLRLPFIFRLTAHDIMK